MKPLWRIFLLILMATFVLTFPLFHNFSVVHVSKQDPVVVDGIVLNAPEVCEVGELVRLDVRESTVEGVKWEVLPATDDFEIVDDGRRAFFSSRAPGSYLFLIAGAKGGVAYLIHHTIIVEGGVPGPGPIVISVTQKVEGWAKKVPDYEGKKAHAAGLAAVFTKLADAQDVKVEQLLEATALANSAVLGTKLEIWVPFLEALGNELDALVANGSLTTREQYKEVWLQIAKGLEKAAK